ncbi:O-antigen ligase family protein [Nocardioides rubriscoriae]|uniref:O-antigen ligase family protein n=1 Tax=Nocardioides rubriscoriae TaxID=642762 RepID=UPI0011E05102|nr:O-antigen ligase family protein [Nocardioides rubriscoriae]
MNGPVSASWRRRLALGLLVAAPLVSVPGGFSGHVPAALLLTTLGCLVALSAPAVGVLPRPLVVVGVAWLAVLVVAALAGETPVASLVGRWPRYEGAPVLVLYAAAAWAGARVFVVREPWLARALAAASAVLAVASVVAVAGGEGRSGALLGNASDQGAVAMMAALVLARPAVRDRSPVEVVGLVAALTTVAASGSRTALALTAVGLVVLLARVAVLPLVILLAAMVAAALAVPSTRDRLVGAETGRARLDQWRLTLDLVADHPWLGLGPSRYGDAFPAHESAGFVRFTGPSVLADSPHSLALQVLVAGGAALLAVSAVGVVLVARRCAAAVRADATTLPLVVAVAAYLGSVAVNFTTAGPTCLAAVLLGAAVALPAGDRPPRSVLAPGSLLLVGVVVLAAACVGDVRTAQGIDAAVDGDVGAVSDRLDAAHRWRPWDADLGTLAAPALAQRASSGLPGADGAAGLAEEWAEQGLARSPDDYRTLVALAVARSVEGRYAEAVTVLDRAVRLAPRRPDAYVQRAIARVGLGTPEGRRAALADARAAAAITPRSPVVRRLLRVLG